MDFMTDLEEYQLFGDLGLVDDSFAELSTPGPDNELKSILGSVFPGDGLADQHKLVIDQAGHDVLEDLLQLSNSSSEGNLDAEWMENVEFSQFLSTENEVLETSSNKKPVETSPLSNTSHSVLHELLTRPIVQKTATPPSPEAQVAPVLSQFDFLESEMANADIVQMAVAESHIATSSSSNTPTAVEVLPEISFDTDMDSSSLNTSSSVLDTSDEHLLDLNAEEFLGSPLSAEDIDSLLSEPASPQSDDNADPDYMPCQNRSMSQKSKPGRKTTAVPYEKPLKGLDRKERKKLQNKNAAIRYRQKKREEKGNLSSEIDQLMDRNTELKDQVDSIAREIKYMKDLITEVCKAKGLKVTFKK